MPAYFKLQHTDSPFSFSSLPLCSSSLSIWLIVEFWGREVVAFSSPNVVLGAAVSVVVVAAAMATVSPFSGPDSSGLPFFSLQVKERKADCCVMWNCVCFLGMVGDWQ